MVHLVFAIKSRRRLISDEIRDELHAYLAAVMRACDSPIMCVGSHIDHVHILCSLSKNIPLSKAVEMVKKRSSKWIKTKGPPYSAFQWQNGYGAFSVSPSNAASVARYIQNQETHHRKFSFEDEFRRLLKRHSLDYDERYVWD